MFQISFKDKQVRFSSDTNWYTEISIVFCAVKYVYALANTGENVISDLLLFFLCAEIFILHRFCAGSNKISLSDMIFFKAFSARMNVKQILN